jgi:hypothetical protein
LPDSGLVAWVSARRCAGVIVVADVPPGVVVTLVEPAAPVVADAPGVAVAPGVVVAGAGPVGVAPGAVDVAPGVAGVVAVVGAAAGVVTVVVTGGLVDEPEPPASLTSAAASTPSASTAITATVAAGARQLGVAARRVRAAAPQFRHQSCSGSSGAPHSGHVSVVLTCVAGGRGEPATSWVARSPELVAAVTNRSSAAG